MNYSNYPNPYNYQPYDNKPMNYGKPIMPPMPPVPPLGPGELYDVDEAFIRGNISPKSFRGYKNYVPMKPRISNEREQLMYNISKHRFYAHELGLLLDVNPTNPEYLRLSNEHRDMGNNYVRDYENKYGCVTPYSQNLNKNPWPWIESPWPWQM